MWIVLNLWELGQSKPLMDLESASVECQPNEGRLHHHSSMGTSIVHAPNKSFEAVQMLVLASLRYRSRKEQTHGTARI